MPFPYLYDPTGLLPANAITDELHHVAPPVDLDRANFIVPRAAPYFATGLVIRTGVTVGSPTLVEGVDYIYTHHFVEASQHLSTPVYGSIMFLNRAYVGDVYVSYHTLGGAYTLDDYGVVETLTRSLYNIRTVTWDQLIGVPALFPVVPHPHDVADLTGMSEVVTALTNIITAIQGNAGNIGSLMSTLINHIDGISSHNKAQVGLPYLENYGMAGTPELTTRPTNKYVSPAWVWQAIELFNLGEAGVSQATDTVVGITRYATDVEAVDQDNPLDNVAVSAAGMWLAIATNTERLAGATIVTGVDFNTPPYREDGYWAFTNAINTSITPSSGYICTKKAGTKAYQTETLDNGEISNRMYTGTTWTPWIRAYVATYYGTLPATILNGNVDLNDYTTPGFYVFDTHNVIAHSPPAFGVASEYEMMVYATSNQYVYFQVVRNRTADISAIRSFSRFGGDTTIGDNGWVVINNITHVLPATTATSDLIVTGVYLILNGYSGGVYNVKTSPTTGNSTAVFITPLHLGYGSNDSLYGWHNYSGHPLYYDLTNTVWGGNASWLRFSNLDTITNSTHRLVFTSADHNTGLPPTPLSNDYFYDIQFKPYAPYAAEGVAALSYNGSASTGAYVELINAATTPYTVRVPVTVTMQNVASWSRLYIGIPGFNFGSWVLNLALSYAGEVATETSIESMLVNVLYQRPHFVSVETYPVTYYETTVITPYADGLVQRGWTAVPRNIVGNTDPYHATVSYFYRLKPTATGVWGPKLFL